MSRVRKCSSGGRPGYKWEQDGECHTYDRNSEIDEQAAKAYAIADGLRENKGRSKKDVLRYEDEE